MKFSPTKRLLTALLTASLLLSATACTNSDLDLPLPSSADSTTEGTQPTEQSTEQPTEAPDDPSTNANPAYTGDNYRVYRMDSEKELYRYEIYDQSGNLVKEEKGLESVDIDVIDDTLLKIEVNHSCYFYHIFENKFSPWYWFTEPLQDVSENLMVYTITRDGKTTMVICDIFDPFENSREIELDASMTDYKAELLYRDNILCIENYKNGELIKTEYHPFSNTVVDFASYESILATYHKLIEIRPKPYQWLWGYPELAESALPLFSFVSEDAKKEFYNLAYLSNEYYVDGRSTGYEWYTTEATATFGYTYRDLNADGSDELLLLTEDYKLLAIYTMKDGKPIQIGEVFDRRMSCTIDEQNRLHIFGSSGAVYSTERVCVLGKDGSLETIVEYGFHGTDKNQNLIYIKREGDTETVISKAEYDALDELYGLHLPEGMLAAEYMRLTVGLGFTPLEPITKLEKIHILSWDFSRESNFDYTTHNFLTVNFIYQESVILWIGGALQKGIIATPDGNKIYFAEEGFVGYLEIGGNCAWITIEECENALYPAGTYLLPYFEPSKG